VGFLGDIGKLDIDYFTFIYLSAVLKRLVALAFLAFSHGLCGFGWHGVT
jgi:hypothetical protein